MMVVDGEKCLDRTRRDPKYAKYRQEKSVIQHHVRHFIPVKSEGGEKRLR